MCLRKLRLSTELQRYSFISKCWCFNSLPSGVAPKSLRLADLCLPPVIQCSVLDGLHELVHIIPQHAPSNRASVASLLLPWGQWSNRGTELQQHVSSGGWISQKLEDEALWLWCVCLFSLSRRVKLDVHLRRSWRRDRCTVLFEFSLYPQFNLQPFHRRKTLANASWCFFFSSLQQNCENGAKTMTSPPDWRNGELQCLLRPLPRQELYNFEPLLLQCSAWELMKLQITWNKCDFTSVDYFHSLPWAP